MKHLLMLSLLTLSFITYFTPEVYSAESAYISVGTAKTRKSVLAMPQIKVVSGLGDPAKAIHDVVTSDLNFMDLFRFLPQNTFIENANGGVAPNTFKMTDWSSIGTDFVIKSALSSSDGTLTLESYMYEVSSNKLILSKKYVAKSSDTRTMAHTFANDLVNTLTGLPGIFLTKLVTSCDRTSKKEIYIMDFDGSNIRQITSHRSIALGPTWSPDGKKIAYSLYTRHKGNIKNLDLFELELASNNLKLLSNRKGMNSGAAYHPNGKSLLLTMSFLGNPEIFSLDLASGNATRISKSFGVDVDPSFNPDGSKIAFVSSRSGNSMVFSMNADGSNSQRLTFAGVYNATPSWSPTNNKIAFAGWLDKHFDIFMMNPDGSKIERLTKNQGSNEDPTFSPDGNFIAFSSNRTGQKNIYVMNVDGTFVRRLTYGMGNCVAPKWSRP